MELCPPLHLQILRCRLYHQYLGDLSFILNIIISRVYRTTVLNFFRPTWFWNFFSRPKWNDIAGGDIEQNSEDNIWTYKRGRKGKMNKITTREVS